jgi:IMP dehydrogenase/GMP reductase
MFLFFSVARSQEIGSWERAAEVAPTSNTSVEAGVTKKASKAAAAAASASANFGMNMPLMSSAFDTSMWLNAA